MHDVVMPIWWHCGLSGVQYVPSELCYTFWVAARCATSHSVPPAVQIEGCEGWRLSQSTGSSSQNVRFLPTAGLLTFLYIFTKIPLFPVYVRQDALSKSSCTDISKENHSFGHSSYLCIVYEPLWFYPFAWTACRHAPYHFVLYSYWIL